MKKNFPIFCTTSYSYLLLLFLCFLNINRTTAQPDYTKYVNPFVGTGGHGHTFPGATLPFGMVQLSPDTRIDGSWDGCGGYYYGDSVIYGFSHTHLNGTGCSDYGDIMLMPMAGEPSLDYKVYASAYSHQSEKASPGYYSVMLDDEKIGVELTASTRVGLHRYSFPKTRNMAVVLDLLHRDKLLEGTIRKVNNTTFEGIRRSEAWARDQRVYYRIEFSKEVIDFKLEQKNGNQEKAIFKFTRGDDAQLLVKVAISGVSEAGAANNMKQEMPGWDFEKAKEQATAAWKKELGKIEVSGGTEEQMKIFYTALYHCFLQPNTYNDVDGRYRGRDMQIHTADGFTYYTVFSLWDTFRAWHPLLTILDRKRTSDFIRTFLAQYQQGGMLPVWELSSNETECMIGYHSVSVMADAMVKGIQGFDYEKAFEAMKHSAEARNRFGLGAYIDHGCLSIDDENESVSKTLEYAYDDWCIAQVARLLKKDHDFKVYSERAQSWKNLFDPSTKFIRPRKNGGWYEPFDPHEVNNNYTEANGWQYTFFVPQDIETLISMSGGPDAFEKKLDELFSTSSQTTGREQADITGLIGQYAHGNEPSHHMAYLYQYIGKPEKTQALIHKVLTEFYHSAPDGLIGNEDCGQMSAWFVMSSMGLYQVCPGSDKISLTNPLFPQVKITPDNGNPLVIVNSAGTQPCAIYADNKKIEGTFMPATRLTACSELVFRAPGNHASNGEVSETAEAVSQNQQPTAGMLVNPLIAAPSNTFKNSLMVELKSVSPKASVYYTLNGSTPQKSSTAYTSPIRLDSSATIKAIAIDDKGNSSKVVTGYFYKMLHPEWKIKIRSTYSKQYTAGGDEGIIDGIRGDSNWKKGNWQGYQAQDFECTIDMGKEQTVSTVGAGFLQDTRAWILMPKQAEFSFSTDNIHFSDATIIKNSVDPKDYTEQTKDFTQTIAPQKARYVKVKAVNFGKLPEWHQGYPFQGEAYIFVDELMIK